MPDVRDIREAYQYGAGELPSYHSANYSAIWRERGAEFDEWLAEHDAEVRAEALRQFAAYRFLPKPVRNYLDDYMAAEQESAGAQPSSDSRYSTSRTGGISQPQDGQTQMPAGDDMTVKHSRHRGPNSQSSSTDGSYDTQTQNGDPK